MDVAWFLNQRLDFILQLYARSSAPFVERQTKSATCAGTT
jgi:hypothetical protein